MFLSEQLLKNEETAKEQSHDMKLHIQSYYNSYLYVWVNNIAY